jgi:hypothetical protein
MEAFQTEVLGKIYGIVPSDRRILKKLQFYALSLFQNSSSFEKGSIMNGITVRRIHSNLGRFQKPVGFEPARLLLLCFTLAALFPPGARGQELPGPEADALTVLEEVLLSPDFGGETPGWGIRFKPRPGNGHGPELPPVPWLEGITRIFAWGLRFLLVSGLAVLGVLLGFRLQKMSREKSAGPVQTGLLSPPRKQERPESLLERARTLHGEGKLREAWGYCFSGAVAAFSQYRGLVFPPNATEYDCLALAPAVPGFRGLVTAWVGLAYGGKIPPDGAFEGALDFCRSLLTPPAFSSAPGKNHG